MMSDIKYYKNPETEEVFGYDETQNSLLADATSKGFIDVTGHWPPDDVAIPESITPLQGLRALDAAGLSAAFTTWASSADRTFLERAFIDKAQTWRRDDPVLVSGAQSLSLTDEQLDQLFVAASKL